METNEKPNQEGVNTTAVTSRYLFFYEGDENGWTFTVDAKNHEEAFDKAYEQWGPQVEDMYYRVI